MTGFDNFVSLEEDLRNEKQDRIDAVRDRLGFGNTILDLSLKGIFKRDFILVGSDSGHGKTELAVNIARANARADKKVTLFALEADPHEIGRRLLYPMLVDRFHRDTTRNKKNLKFLNYYDWLCLDLEEELGQYEDEEKAKLAKEGPGFIIRYRGSEEFTFKNFEREMAAVKESDLVIVDHFHYFDLDADSPQKEMSMHKQLIKDIRNIVQTYAVPIVLVAHLRKRDYREKQGSPVPSMDDFMGTSDLYKIPNKIILIARGPAFNPPISMSIEERGRLKNSWTTYFNIAKLRADGSRTRFLCRGIFDASANQYMDRFTIGRINKGEWESLSSDDVPHWAKGHVMQDVTTVDSHKPEKKNKNPEPNLNKWGINPYHSKEEL